MVGHGGGTRVISGGGRKALVVGRGIGGGGGIRSRDWVGKHMAGYGFRRSTSKDIFVHFSLSLSHS